MNLYIYLYILHIFFIYIYIYVYIFLYIYKEIFLLFSFSLSDLHISGRALLYVSLVNLLYKYRVNRLYRKKKYLILSSFSGTVVTFALCSNILFKNLIMHLPKFFMRNLEKPETKQKHRWKRGYNKSNLNSSGIELVQFMYTPLKVSFLYTLVTNFPFSIYILTNSFSIQPSPTPWNHQKTVRFSDVFRG